MTILMITKVVVIRFNLLFNSALVRAKAEIMDTKMNKKNNRRGRPSHITETHGSFKR